VAAIWGIYDQVVERLDQVVEARPATTAKRCSIFGSSPLRTRWGERAGAAANGRVDALILLGSRPIAQCS
jgi:hypothetical protein